MQVSNPLQQVVLGDTGEDQFPVFQVDGVTKVPGLNPAVDMAVTVFQNQVEEAGYPAPVIATIGATGEYSISFQTLAKGQLIIEVAVAAHSYIWKGFYGVVDPYVLPGQKYRGVVRDDRGNARGTVTVEVLDANTAQVLATVESDTQGAYAIALTGDLASRRLVDLRFSGSGLATYVLEDVVLA